VLKKFTKEWLEKQSALEEGLEASTGSMDLAELERQANALEQTPQDQQCFATTFGTLIYFLRHSKRWSRSQLASKADIDENVLDNIENITEYTPEPRAVLQLAKLLGFPSRKMLEVAGLIITHDVKLRDHAVRFAASGKDFHKLSTGQKKILEEFVKYLAKKD
jgi:transcriptional regulator with XRE-family HTH domain